MRLRRKQLKLSQTALAAAVGLTFQQIQKYELGANRVSASVLFKAAGKLDVPVAYFFEGLEREGRGESADADLCAMRALVAVPQIRFVSDLPRRQRAALGAIIDGLASNPEPALT